MTRQVAKSAVLLAAKMRERDVNIPNIKMISQICDDRQSVADIAASSVRSLQTGPSVEVSITKYFGWNLQILTIHDYMLRFMHTGLLMSKDKITQAGESDIREGGRRESHDYYFYTRRFSDRHMSQD